MARITVEDCIDKVDGPYDLVMIAKERAVQLNSGEQSKVDPEKDKNTVIALREISEEKISVKELEEAAIHKLRKHTEEDIGASEEEEKEGDDFEKIYKGEVSKSGIPILPSKRARKIPEKIGIFKTEETKIEKEISKDTNLPEENVETSLEELEEEEKQAESSDEISTENSDNT